MRKTNVHNTPRTAPSPRMRWFSDGELKCAWCRRPMPKGYYGKTKRIFLCSPICTLHFYCENKRPIRCKCCGKLFKPQTTNQGARFCSREHFDLWRRRQTDEKKFGRFASLVRDFIQAAIPAHRVPGSERDLRCNLAHFLVFIRRRRLRSLAKVSPKDISAFFSSLVKTRPKSAGKVFPDLHLFFEWLILTGRRTTRNPVNKKIHSQVQTHYLPRPYTDVELKIIDSLLQATGDPRLELAVAIGLKPDCESASFVNCVSPMSIWRNSGFVSARRAEPVSNASPIFIAARNEHWSTGWKSAPMSTTTIC